MLTELADFIKTYGEEQINNLNDPSPKEFIETILHIYHHMSRIVSEGFREDQPFMKTLDKSLRTLFNKFPKTPEYLAKYCDSLLKKSKELPESSELEKKLDQIVKKFFFLLN